MQFKVPQFIDVEDKVFGSLTFKQFAYLAGGGGLVYLTFKILPTIIAFPIAVLFAGLALALAFFKYNEKPFIHTLEAFVRYYLKARLYLWHKRSMTEQKVSSETAPKLPADQTGFTESKLKTLSWSLDVIDPKGGE